MFCPYYHTLLMLWCIRPCLVRIKRLYQLKDNQISKLEDLEVVPGYRIKNTIIADLECMCNLRGLSGNSGTHPFYDCICTQQNRNRPKSERQPCQPRLIKDCIAQNDKWWMPTLVSHSTLILAHERYTLKDTGL